MSERETNEENITIENNEILSGLNLVLILSSLSSSDDHIQEPEQERDIKNLNHKPKYSGSRSNFSTTRQQSTGLNRKQQMPKIQANIRDCR